MKTWVTLSFFLSFCCRRYASTEPSHEDLGDLDHFGVPAEVGVLQRSPVMKTWVTGKKIIEKVIAGMLQRSPVMKTWVTCDLNRPTEPPPLASTEPSHEDLGD